ncbi:MAG: hypothetical protein AB2693_25710, partial [Candidatus Thiodiazotropha sp.]
MIKDEKKKKVKQTSPVGYNCGRKKKKGNLIAVFNSDSRCNLLQNDRFKKALGKAVFTIAINKTNNFSLIVTR